MLKLRRWIFIAWTLIPTSPRRKAPDLLKQSPDAIVSKQSPDAIVSSAVRGAQQRGTPVKDAIRDCLLHKDHAVREAAMRVIGPSSYVLFTVFLTDTSRQNGPEPDKRRGRRFNTMAIPVPEHRPIASSARHSDLGRPHGKRRQFPVSRSL